MKTKLGIAQLARHYFSVLIDRVDRHLRDRVNYDIYIHILEPILFRLGERRTGRWDIDVGEPDIPAYARAGYAYFSNAKGDIAWYGGDGPQTKVVLRTCGTA